MPTKINICHSLGLAVVLSSFNVDTDAMNAKERPNVIIILTDDQGYGDFSCHGNPVLETPALDKLYNESIRLNNFHVSPLCTPTRGQLMTGLDAFNNKAATVLTARNLMRRDIVTMPEIFSKNGYVTGIFGKWHLGDIYPDRPMDRGFQKCIWHKGWGLLSEIEYDNDYYETRYMDSLDIKQSGEYCTNLWFNKAIEWMSGMAKQEKPFFTYLALNSPHGPFFSPIQDFLYYRDKVDSTSACFLGMIRNIDRNMQNLETWLEKSGLKENTLIMFMTDNGGTGGVKIYNAGMRDKKGSNYDGGHRAACFIRWPDGKLGHPRTISDASQIQDILPTFIDLLGLNASKDISFDGESLFPILKSGKSMDDRMFVVQYGGHVKPEKYAGCVVRDSWRLVGENELYDLSNDPGQERNIASEHPETLNIMKEFYESWWTKTEPGINQFVPVIIGSAYENPVIINSTNWEIAAVNTQWAVALAAGDPKGSVSHIHVSQQGNYRVELSRWPFHLNREITKAGPENSVGGTKIRSGKAIPVEYGCVSINNGEPLISTRSTNATFINFEIKLQAGDTTFQAWFKDINGKNLCGAYYVRFEL